MKEAGPRKISVPDLPSPFLLGLYLPCFRRETEESSWYFRGGCLGWAVAVLNASFRNKLSEASCIQA